MSGSLILGKAAGGMKLIAYPQILLQLRIHGIVHPFLEWNHVVALN
jgi:hypothetical protein